MNVINSDMTRLNKKKVWLPNCYQKKQEAKEKKSNQLRKKYENFVLLHIFPLQMKIKYGTNHRRKLSIGDRIAETAEYARGYLNVSKVNAIEF